MNADGLYFEPWIGADYARVQQGRRDGATEREPWAYPFHVLGESHYADEKEYEPGLTCSIVAQCGFSTHHEKCSAFFSKVLKIVGAEENNQLRRQDHWRKLAFSNYIQDVLSGPRVCPSEGQWERGRRAFSEQLKATTPQVLLVLGERLWKHLPQERDFGFRVPHLESTSGDVSVNEAWAYVYQCQGTKHLSLAVYVIHPSAGGGSFKAQIAAERARIAGLHYSNIHNSLDFASHEGRSLD